MKKLLILFIVLQITLVPTLFADSGEFPREKSMAVAWTLSLLPINAPAFFYANQPIKGAIVTPLQLAGVGLSIYGLISLINFWGETMAESVVAGVGVDTNTDDNLSTFGAISIITGPILYWGTWIYSVIRAPKDTREYNDFIRAGEVSITPTFSFDDKSVYAGINVRF